MSNDAINWAKSLPKKIGGQTLSGTAKFVLIVMADAVRDPGKEGRSAAGIEWPPYHCFKSIDSLVADTNLKRDTIIDQLAKLQQLGLITHVGLDGQTRQVKVYLLHVITPATGNLPETGSLPVFDEKPPASGDEAPQLRIESLPEAGHETLGDQDKKANKEPLRSSRLKASTGLVTFAAYRQRLKDAGELFLPDDDPIYAYTDRIGLDDDFFVVHIHRFKQVYLEEREEKKYADWRSVFRNSVQGNWFDLWIADPSTNAFRWSNKGLQALKDYRAIKRERERAVAIAVGPTIEVDAAVKSSGEEGPAQPGGTARAALSALRDQLATLAPTRSVTASWELRSSIEPCKAPA